MKILVYLTELIVDNMNVILLSILTLSSFLDIKKKKYPISYHSKDLK